MTLPGTNVQAKPHVGTLVWAIVAIFVVLGLYHLMAGRRR